jgi:hypothetical protein
MNKLTMIPLLDACLFPGEVEEELSEAEVNTHYQCDILFLDWKEQSYLDTKKWLIDTYGEEIKKHTKFGILAT